MESEKLGYLHKYGENIVTDAWRKRWFILRGNQLLYFKDVQDSHAAGIIPLSDATINYINKEEFTFEIDTAYRSFRLKGGNMLDTVSWFKAIERVVSNNYSKSLRLSNKIAEDIDGGGKESVTSPKSPESPKSNDTSDDSKSPKWVKPTITKDRSNSDVSNTRPSITTSAPLLRAASRETVSLGRDKKSVVDIEPGRTIDDNFIATGRPLNRTSHSQRGARRASPDKSTPPGRGNIQERARGQVRRGVERGRGAPDRGGPPRGGGADRGAPSRGAPPNNRGRGVRGTSPARGQKPQLPVTKVNTARGATEGSQPLSPSLNVARSNSDQQGQNPKRAASRTLAQSEGFTSTIPTQWNRTSNSTTTTYEVFYLDNFYIY